MIRFIGDIPRRTVSVTGVALVLLGLLGAGVISLLSGQALAGQVPAGYRINPGDRLAVSVAGHAELSGEALVDQSGRATLPLIGPVPATGKTVAELRDYITLALDGGYVFSPQVSVEVLNYQPVKIIGEVENPGSYSHVEGMTVAMAVEAAGGFTREAYVRMVFVVRGDDPGKTPVEVGPDEPVRPGDAIEVARKLY